MKDLEVKSRTLWGPKDLLNIPACNIDCLTVSHLRVFPTLSESQLMRFSFLLFVFFAKPLASWATPRPAKDRCRGPGNTKTACAMSDMCEESGDTSAALPPRNWGQRLATTHHYHCQAAAAAVVLPSMIKTELYNSICFETQFCRPRLNTLGQPSITVPANVKCSMES